MKQPYIVAAMWSDHREYPLRLPYRSNMHPILCKGVSEKPTRFINKADAQAFLDHVLSLNYPAYIRLAG